MANSRTRKKGSGRRRASTDVASFKQKLAEIDQKLKEQIEKFREARGGIHCYPLLLNASIRQHLVDDVYEELQDNFHGCDGKLDVIVESPGGDIDAAYNLTQLFRRFGSEELNFIVPRWAKSAATLLVCSGNRILMTAVAELGPMDPQITSMNPLEGRMETFSPLHIESTLELIRDEFEKGNPDLARALTERLQFPMTLGSYRKTLDIAKQYLRQLLTSRMLKDVENSEQLAAEIAKRLSEGYADHGFCINLEEAKNIGLIAEELIGDVSKIAWCIHRLSSNKETLIKKQKERELQKKLKELPPGILEKLPPEIQQQLTSGEGT